MENTTIKTIAADTGLSLTTVSRVLNGTAKQYRVSTRTQEKVLAAARKLQYTPNQAAVNLRLKRSFSIGLVVPSLSNPFFSNIASIVSSAFRALGFSVILIDCEEKEEAEVEATQSLAARNIDGIIVIPSGRNKIHLELLLQKKIPVISIDRYFDDIAVSYVATHHYEGAYNITEYLIRCGHQRIACLQGNPFVVSNMLRVDGYTTAIKANGFPVFYVAGNSFTAESGYVETKLLLQKPERPTAILALSDTILLGVLKALAEEGLQIPGDMSVVTFDNSSYLDFLSCPVTSVAQPVTDIANIAIKLLTGKIASRTTGVHHQQEKILLKPTIIHRKSVAIIPR